MRCKVVGLFCSICPSTLLLSHNVSKTVSIVTGNPNAIHCGISCFTDALRRAFLFLYIHIHNKCEIPLSNFTSHHSKMNITGGISLLYRRIYIFFGEVNKTNKQTKIFSNSNCILSNDFIFLYGICFQFLFHCHFSIPFPLGFSFSLSLSSITFTLTLTFVHAHALTLNFKILVFCKFFFENKQLKNFAKVVIFVAIADKFSLYAR